MLVIHFEGPDPLHIRMQDLDYNTRVLYHRWEDTDSDEDWEKFRESLFENFQVEKHLLAQTDVSEIYEIE